MSEELLGGNQTPEPELTETIEQPIDQQIETPEQSQPQDYFTVKYNKEDRQVSYDEAPEYIQKGMNYDKTHQRATEYENYLNRVARLSGYEDHNQMVAALDEIEQQQERERYEQAGIDPDKFNQLVSELPEIQEMRQMKAQQRENEIFQAEAQELFQEFPDLKPEDIPAEAWALKETKGLSILDAYLRTAYKSLGQQKEQEAIQKLQQNQVAATGPLGGGIVEHNTSIKDMKKDDFETLIRKVKNGEVRNL